MVEAGERARWPVISRPEPEARLRASLVAGHFVVTGATGCGKTTLCTRVLNSMLGHTGAGSPPRATSHWRLITGSQAGRNLAFAAIAPLLDAHPTNPAAVLASARSVLRQGRIGVVLADDAHALDEPSALVLRQLATEGTVRLGLVRAEGERLPDALRAWAAGDNVTWLTVGPISTAEGEKLLVTALGGPVEAASAQRLIDAAAGNLFYLRELVFQARQQGALVESDGLWRLRGMLSFGPLLSEVLSKRLDPLSRDLRAGAELLAVSGPLTVDEVERVVEPRLVDELDHLGLVTVSAAGGPPTVDLSSSLYREALLAGLSPLRARRIRRQLVAGLDDPTDDLSRLRLALWTLDAGLPPDPQRTLAAAFTAIAASDTRTASRLAMAVWDARSPGEPAERAGLLAARTLIDAGDLAGTERLLREIIADGTDPVLRACAAVLLSEHELQVNFDEAASEEAIRLAEQQLDNQTSHGLIAGRRALNAMAAGRLLEAAELASPLLDHPSPEARAMGGFALANCLLHQAQPFALLAMATTTQRYALEADQQVSFGLVQGAKVIAVLALQLAGQTDVAWSSAVAFDEATAFVPSPLARASACIVRARIAQLQDRHLDADRQYREVILLYADAHQRCLGRWARIMHIATLIELGSPETEAALAALAPEPVVGILDPLLLRLRAVFALRNGEHAAGLELLGQAVELAKRNGNWGPIWDCVLDCVVNDEFDLAAQIAQDVPEGAGSLYEVARHALRAATARDQEALLQAAQVAAGHRMPGRAADLAATAGRLARSAGDEHAASRNDLLAHRYLRDSEGAVRPRSWAPGALSSRELEIARLAQEGLSNREIAARLYLAPKTVENHLGRVFAKLGVRGRIELSAALGPIAEPDTLASDTGPH